MLSLSLKRRRPKRANIGGGQRVFKFRARINSVKLGIVTRGNFYVLKCSPAISDTSEHFGGLWDTFFEKSSAISNSSAPRIP